MTMPRDPARAAVRAAVLRVLADAGTVWLVSGIQNMPNRGLVTCVAVLAGVAEIAALAPPAASTRALTRLLGLRPVLLGPAEAAVTLNRRNALRGTHSRKPGTPAATT
ncbi:hypothetical protein [Streptomyces flaveolus]|uniref:hypothetical protein n=1 Tax=Streptomyces flaveolus TaxID=67297 RepID=UPI0036F9980A